MTITETPSSLKASTIAHLLQRTGHNPQRIARLLSLPGSTIAYLLAFPDAQAKAHRPLTPKQARILACQWVQNRTK